MNPNSLKKSLHLPKSEFSMKANLVQREPLMLEQWEKIDCYSKILQSDRDEVFLLHDGPPYANGDIHIGHAVNKILKDIINRSQALLGKKVMYMPGWDCHGLPIEHAVEKKYGKGRLQKNEFKKKCRDYATKQISRQLRDFSRLGILTDWNTVYKTMDYSTEAKTLKALKMIWQKGNLLQGAKPVHWCCDCRSALAEAEVEYAPHESPAIDVAFVVSDPGSFLNHFSNLPTSVIIWTTTPWTIPANQAVAVGPKIEYVLLSNSTRQLIVAVELAQQVLERIGDNSYKEVTCFNGDQLQTSNSKIMLQHPLLDRSVPIVCADYVILDIGSGAVHTAPAHGLDDYSTGVRYGLAVESNVDSRGRFAVNDKPMPWDNMNVQQANHVIIDELGENVLSNRAYQHSYPHCWRHKTPLIFRATPQWFIAIDTEVCLHHIQSASWFPDWGEARISKMVSQRAEWCVSRQRLWGVPIPICLNKQSGEIHPRQDEIFDFAIDAIAQKGVEGWSQDNPRLLELLADEKDEYHLVGDILDVWFDSGVSHFSILAEGKPDKQVTANLYLEGSDQHRGWFQSSLLTAIAMGRTIPYKHVLTHGFVVDELGRKMSKSLGNVISPQELFKTLGADILRLMVAHSDTSGEMKFSEGILKQNTESYRRIRNTLRYLHSNLHDLNTEKVLPFEELLLIDKWIIIHTDDMLSRIYENYQNYAFHTCVQEIVSFCSITLGSFYLEINKDRLYTGAKNGQVRSSAQSAMFYILHRLIRAVAPILPFTCEELWQIMRKTDSQLVESVFLTTYDDLQIYTDKQLRREELSLIQLSSDEKENGLVEYIAFLQTLKESSDQKLETLRANGDVGSSLNSEVLLTCDAQTFSVLSKLGDEIRFILICSHVELRLNDTLPILSEVEVSAQASKQPKCDRCWHHVETTQHTFTDESENMVCHRCIVNMTKSDGEKRNYF